MLSAVFVRAAPWRALALMLAIASAQARMTSLPSAAPPSAAPPASGLCQKLIQATEGRLLAIEASLESKSEALLALRMTFDRLFQLLNIEESKIPYGTGYSIDGQKNDTIIEMVTLGPTDGGRAVEGSALSGDDENLDVIYKVDIELDQNSTPEDEVQEGSDSPGDDEDLGSGFEGGGFPGDDEDLKSAFEGSGFPGDDENLKSAFKGSGFSGDDEDPKSAFEGSGFPGDDEDLEKNLEGSG